MEYKIAPTNGADIAVVLILATAAVWTFLYVHNENKKIKTREDFK